MSASPPDLDRALSLAGIEVTAAERARLEEEVRSLVAWMAQVRRAPTAGPAVRSRPRPVPTPSGWRDGPDWRGAALERVEGLHALRPAGPARPATGSGMLSGASVAVKANLAVAGWPLDADAAMLRGHVAARDADVVAALRRAGGTVVARTAMDAFGMGIGTETGLGRQTRHPVDPARSPGGSSGGSAVAVARSAVDLALGSDTGGSVRAPAALCGVVGLSPTWGRVSRAGLVSFAPSLDTVGVLGRDVASVAAGLHALSGPSSRDATAADRPAPGPRVGRGVAGLRLGLVRDARASASPGVREALDAAVDAWRAAGAAVVAVDVPGWGLAAPTYVALSCAEASSTLARYDGLRYGPSASGATASSRRRAARSEGFGPEVRRRLVLGAWLTSRVASDAWWGAAVRAREGLRAQLAAVLSDVHALVLPTMPCVAWPRGAMTDPVLRHGLDRFTTPSSLAGLPACSVPAGAVGGLPVGVQVVGRRFDESTVLRVAGALG